MPAPTVNPLLLPLLAMVGLTLLVWIRLYVVRVREMKRSRIDPQRLAGSADKGLLKDTRASDNFINLFEVPVLFYVLVLASVAAGVQDPLLLALAWAFVALRVVHSGYVAREVDVQRVGGSPRSLTLDRARPIAGRIVIESTIPLLASGFCATALPS